MIFRWAVLAIAGLLDPLHDQTTTIIATQLICACREPIVREVGAPYELGLAELRLVSGGTDWCTTGGRNVTGLR